MELTIKRIADVHKARITLNGITVLAGKNDTGKSTVSKSLWSMVRSLENVTKQVERERTARYVHILNRLLGEITYDSPVTRNYYGRVRHLAQKLARMSENGPLNPEFIRGELQSSFDFLHDEPSRDTFHFGNLDDGFDRISELADFSTIPDGHIVRVLLQNKLLNEFNGQVNNVDAHSRGTIALKHERREFTASIEDDTVVDFTFGAGLQQTAIYLDDPFALDYYRSAMAERMYSVAQSEDHRSHASALLHPSNGYGGDVLVSIMADRKIGEVMHRLDSAVSGTTAASNKHGIVYRRPGGKEDIDIRNISSGMKSFASIKTLLREGRIHDGDVLIIDEPENHLHPQWQLVFAEVIVLLHKAFDLRILMATHSPYFLRAIEVYSAHHEVADRCKYYHATRDEDGASFQDVTFDTDRIYEDMSVPFALLDDLMPEE